MSSKSNINFYRIIKSFDIYGSNINFTLNNKSKSKTLIGGIISIFSLIFFVFYAIINSKDLLKRLNPAVSKMEIFDNKFINIENFLSIIPISLSFKGLNIDELLNYFYIVAYYEEYDTIKDEYIFGQDIPLEKCSKDFFPNVTSEIYFKYIQETSLCINDSTLNKTCLYYSEGKRGVLYLSISYCLPFINPNCLPLKNITDFIDLYAKEMYVSVGVSGIQPLDYKNPIQYFIQQYHIVPSLHYLKGLDIYLQEETLETDDGLLMQSNKIHKCHNVYETYSYFNNEYSDLILARFRIYPSNHSFYNKRIYTKIQDYFAKIGGIIGLAFNILPHVVYLISVGRRDEKILNILLEFRNEMFSSQILKVHSIKNFQNNYFKNSNEKKKINESSSLQNIKDSNKFLENNLIKDKINTSIEKEVNIFLNNWNNRKKNKIKFSFFEILRLYVCTFICKWKSKKLNLYSQYKKIIHQYLDVPFYINKLEEYDKFKYILFNEQQLSLFKFIPNNFIYSEDFVLKKKILTSKKLFYDNDKEIALMLINFLKENEIKNENEIDQRLIQLFYDSLKN